LLVIATITPDMPMPATACSVQHKLGLATSTACFDLNAACSGFIYALDTACAMIGSGRYRHALVIGVEKLSSIVDWTDRTTCVLFGDGAGAAVIGTSAKAGTGLIGAKLGSYGDCVELLCIPAGGSNTPASVASVEAHGHFLKMKGKEVFKYAVRGMEEAARDILEQHGIAANQIDLVIPHQANLRIIESIAQYLELPLDRFFVNLDRYGNTSAASIPIALDEARRAGRIKAGDLTLLVAFGAGLTYGSALIRW
jgi:3-oxoacyl-[acyl-carrier-protein] synthase-3